jgi:hypothetical protein
MAGDAGPARRRPLPDPPSPDHPQPRMPRLRRMMVTVGLSLGATAGALLLATAAQADDTRSDARPGDRSPVGRLTEATHRVGLPVTLDRPERITVLRVTRPLVRERSTHQAPAQPTRHPPTTHRTTGTRGAAHRTAPPRTAHPDGALRVAPRQDTADRPAGRPGLAGRTASTIDDAPGLRLLAAPLTTAARPLSALVLGPPSVRTLLRDITGSDPLATLPAQPPVLTRPAQPPLLALPAPPTGASAGRPDADVARPAPLSEGRRSDTSAAGGPPATTPPMTALDPCGPAARADAPGGFHPVTAIVRAALPARGSTPMPALPVGPATHVGPGDAGAHGAIAAVVTTTPTHPRVGSTQQPRPVRAPRGSANAPDTRPG